MNLYEVDEAILNCIDQETGEVIDVEKLNELEMLRDQKVSNIGCLIKNNNALIEAIKNEKQNLQKKQTVLENQVESLKNYVKNYLGGEKFKDARVSISYRKSTSTKIDDDLDVNALPDEFKRITIEPNKTSIKKALDAGIEIEGCSLVENTSVIIK